MSSDDPGWAPPAGSPAGTWGWYLASDGQWYQSADTPAPGYLLGPDGRWRAADSAAEAEGTELWRTSRWGLGDAGWGALAWLVASILGGVLLALVAGDDLDDDSVGVFGSALLVALGAAAMAGVPIWASRRKGLRSLRLDFGLRVRFVDVAIGLGLGFAALIGAGLVGAAIDAAFGADEATSNIPVDQLDGTWEMIVFFLAVAVVTPAVEELFFRGLLYRSFLKRGMSIRASFAATTAIFVLPHLLSADSVASLVSLTAAIGILGLSFQLACHLTGNRLAAPIAAHAVVNGLAVLALAFA